MRLVESHIAAILTPPGNQRKCLGQEGSGEVRGKQGQTGEDNPERRTCCQIGSEGSVGCGLSLKWFKAQEVLVFLQCQLAGTYNFLLCSASEGRQSVPN